MRTEIEALLQSPLEANGSPGLWQSRGAIDAAIRLVARTTPHAPARLADALDRHGVSGGILLSEIPDTLGQDATLDAFADFASDRFLIVPQINAGGTNAVAEHRRWTARGARAFSISSLGRFRSPMRPVQPDTIESAPLWRAAAEHHQTLFVEPTVDDAFLLAILAAHFDTVPVIVRGGLVSRMPEGMSSAPRAFPTPDRFTFDRLHQLDSVSILLSPAGARHSGLAVGSYPSGWHDPGNLLALFSAARVLWGSEQALERDGRGYFGPGVPATAFDALTTGEHAAIIGGSARSLFGHG